MPRNSKLSAINDNLHLLGYKIEVLDRKTVVKLPLFCSVSIIEDGEVLKTEAKFGYMSRTTATWLVTILLMIEITAFSFLVSDIRMSVFFGVLAVMAGIWDGYRYILTENFITRFQLLAIETQKSIS